MHEDRRPTVEDVARAALAAVDSEAGVVLAGQWVAERYSELAARTALRQLRREASLVIPATLATGTVAVEHGSPVVLADADAAVTWTPALVGRYFQVQTTWYEITGVEQDREAALLQTRLTLRSPFTDATNPAATYRIVARYVAAPDDARVLGDVVNPRRRLRLLRLSIPELDRVNPERQYFSFGPTVVADFGDDAGAGRRLEFYPYSDRDETVSLTYIARPPALELKDRLPQQVDLAALKEGVLIDVMRHLAAGHAKAGQIEQAAYWRNEARAQETTWERRLVYLVQQDRLLDDTAFILRSSLGVPGQLPGRGEIGTASAEIFARGARP